MGGTAWESLQAQGVEASDAPPGGTLIAYQVPGGFDLVGVGFDLRLSLPPVCVSCGEHAVERWPLRLRVKLDRIGELLQRGRIAAVPNLSELQPGRYTLGLPMCLGCKAKREKADRLTKASALALLAPVISLLSAAILPGSVAVALFVLSLLAIVGLRIAASQQQGRQVSLESLDGDGIIVLRQVHTGAAEAIVAAAAGPSAPG